MTFQTLYNAGSTRRWHTNPTLKDQDLAQHQWGVAMIIREIAPGNLYLLEAALTHDLGESVTGDTPYLGKTKYPKLKEAADFAEAEFAVRHSIPYGVEFTDEEKHCLRWADMFEALLFARREVAMGNQYMQKVTDTAIMALRNIGHPNARAEQLFKDALHV